MSVPDFTWDTPNVVPRLQCGDRDHLYHGRPNKVEPFSRLPWITDRYEPSKALDLTNVFPYVMESDYRNP